MTQLLVRLFVKDFTKTDKGEVRTGYGVLASIVGMLCNFLLFAAKLTIGVMINSISITADAFNNLSDAASSVISFAGAKLAGRPADKEHPFGHGRMEYIAALAVAFLILQVGFSLMKGSVGKIFHPEEVGFQWIMVIILVASVLVKVWLSVFNFTLGKKINSNILKATSADARNDVIVTSATIISILVGKYTGVVIDGWVGFFVSVFVLLAGFNIAKDTLMPLLGEAIGREKYEEITKYVENYEGIVGSHDLILHNYGPTHIMGSIHAEVKSNGNMDEIHDIIDGIEQDVLRDMGIFLVIHMDPVQIDNEKVKNYKNTITKLVLDLEPEATIHDFRMVEGDRCAGGSIFFDLVVPYSYTGKARKEMQGILIEQINDKYGSYECKITIESSFMAE